MKRKWSIQQTQVAQKKLCDANIFLKNGPSPACFIVYFRSFQTNTTILSNNICEKCPFRIRYRDSNPRSLGRESPSITTRPGLFEERLRCS